MEVEDGDDKVLRAFRRSYHSVHALCLHLAHFILWEMSLKGILPIQPVNGSNIFQTYLFMDSEFAVFH